MQLVRLSLRTGVGFFRNNLSVVGADRIAL